MERINTLEQTNCFIKLQAESDIKVYESEIKKNKHGHYDNRPFINDFQKQITETPIAYISFLNQEDLEIEFRTITYPTKRVWKGFFKAGVSSQIGAKAEITISEIWQADTKTYSYGLTIILSKVAEKVISERARKLFGISEKPNTAKPRKRKGAK
ncbi:MAG: hypothetical protein IPQ04_11890 [Saprospiraceae bacterium]|jgi:hypothetical protein|nr:hypothetical protein [Saprospiraceae bacterium]